VKISNVGGYPYAPVMSETLIGYGRCSTDAQDLTAQRDRLRELGVEVFTISRATVYRTLQRFPAAGAAR
jgi:peroxiredoxin